MLRHTTSRSTHSGSASLSPSPPRKTVQMGVSGVANIFMKMRRNRNAVKEHHLESTSGTSQTHLDVAPEPGSSKMGPFTNTDTFVCIGGVKATTLLKATRNTVIEMAESWGANVLVDEQWTCTICRPRQQSGTFRVRICYTAYAVCSTGPDPHKPVALDQVKGVPGLMTILRRNDN